ncbi:MULTISPECIES: sensor domain-containing diguanylate cyclase [unclassified Aureimonas]|uniref:GGDEF domain-containing protein n=1 Tax=unclassified Aureimonas TaxID=2615206 RepID=UPI0006F76E32|nr:MULTISPECIES: diguanylate cyclase [unclassified Aureimonas]KQT53025.1 hypothetical protein ASG62_14075 [Aureimonas sp. Leaf427]KQT80481.1 hypothetical protein ASG54_07925 [Aureimonas sp. Leaf460]
MPVTSTYGESRTSAIRWLSDVGAEVPLELRARLQATPFATKVPLVMGAINSLTITLVAAYRLNSSLLVGFAILECLLLAVRLRLTRRYDKPADPLFAMGLVWAALQAATIWVIVLSGDLVSMIIVLGTSLAVIGGIVARNFATPRYAFAQVMIIDLTFKTAFLFSHPSFMPLIFVQAVLFAAYNLSILKQHRQMALKALKAEIVSREQAVIDPLTQLLNRRGLAEEADRLAKKHPSLVLFYIDLDGFKNVNDRLGHAAGDSLLQEVGLRLKELFGAQAAVSRLGGDEFLILGSFVGDDEIRACGARIIHSLSVPYSIEGNSLALIGASVGAAKWSECSGTLESCMAAADGALYRVKSNGKGRALLAAPSVRTDDEARDTASVAA